MNNSRKRKLYALMVLNIFLLVVLIACTNLLQQHDTNVGNMMNSERNGVLESNEPNNTREEDKQAELFEPEKVMLTSGEDDNHNMLTKGNQEPEPVNLTIETEDKIPDYIGLSYYKEENIKRYEKYQQEHPKFPYEKIVANVNIGLDYPFYECVNLVQNVHDITVLVNKYNKLPDDYKPELVELDASLCVVGRGPQYLRKEAAEALVKMHDDAKQEGLNITAYGTYRSIATQHAIWNNAINSGRTKEDVDSLNSRGGHSEHHTGLAVDVVVNNYSVENTKEFAWYSENADEYGFIIRYPEGKENITGYNYEPWHLRYVGPEIAKDIVKRGLTYEEYYVMFLEPKNGVTVANR